MMVRDRPPEHERARAATEMAGRALPTIAEGNAARVVAGRSLCARNPGLEPDESDDGALVGTKCREEMADAPL